MATAFERAGTGFLCACLVVSALAWGAHRSWPLGATELLAFLALGAVLLRACAEHRLTWIPLPLARPFLAFVGLVGLQIAIGNRRLAEWALAPSGAPAKLPTPMLLLGSVAPDLTRDALVLFLAYVSVYVATVHLLRRRGDVERLVWLVVGLAALLAFAGLVDYLHGEPLVIRWRDEPIIRNRVTGTFVNPDHFASWLAMALFLGIGALLARHARVRSRGEPGSPRRREWRARAGLGFLGLTVIGVALVLTLSRAGLIAVAAAGCALVLALRGCRLAPRNAAIIGGLAAATLAYAVWIGLGPLLQRLAVIEGDYAGRLLQYGASLPMLEDFPLLGVGLGAYREIFPAYQPLALQPGRVYYPYAHNDPLQLVLETGPLGALILVWAVVAVARHVHLYLFGAERRRDPWNVSLALGALAGVVAAFVHAFFDFGTRIPANGAMAAALLGIATVALQTRFRNGAPDLLVDVRTWALGPAARRALAGGVAAAVVAGLAVRAVGPVRSEAWGERPMTRADFEVALIHRPTRPSLHLGLARSVASEGDAAQAMAHLDRAIALAPEDASVRGRSAALLATMAGSTVDRPAARERLLQRGVDEAREAAERAPSILPALVDRYVEAGIPADRLSLLAPADSFGQVQLAVALERRGIVAPALAAYERAARAAPEPDKPLYARFLAAALARAGNHRAAADTLGAAHRLDSQSIPICLALAQELALGGDDAQALFHYRLANELAEREADRPRAPVAGPPRTPSERVMVLQELSLAAFGPEPAAQEWIFQIQVALARFHMDQGEFGEARTILERLAKRADTPPSLLFALGVSYESLAAPDQAEEAFRRAIQLEPRNVAYRLHLAQGLWAREKFFEAIQAWRVAAELQPRNVEIQLRLAQAYERIGEPREAFQQYRRALVVDPANETARRGLAHLTGPVRP